MCDRDCAVRWPKRDRNTMQEKPRKVILFSGTLSELMRSTITSSDHTMVQGNAPPNCELRLQENGSYVIYLWAKLLVCLGKGGRRTDMPSMQLSFIRKRLQQRKPHLK